MSVKVLEIRKENLVVRRSSKNDKTAKMSVYYSQYYKNWKCVNVIRWNTPDVFIPAGGVETGFKEREVK